MSGYSVVIVEVRSTNLINRGKLFNLNFIAIIFTIHLYESN